MKKGFILLWILLVMASVQSKSQSPAFLVSSVGPATGGNVNTIANSSVINLNSISNCIDVKSGLIVLNGLRNSGTFAMSCEVNLQINQLGIKMYPNPVETTTKVKLSKSFLVDQYFNVSILTTDGVLVKNSKELGSTLLQGIIMDLSFLNGGTYVLKVESQNYIDVVKFIKP